MGNGDADASQRLAQLEVEVCAKKTEVAALKEQVTSQVFVVVSWNIIFILLGFQGDRHFLKSCMGQTLSEIVQGTDTS